MQEPGPAPADSLPAILGTLRDSHANPRHCTFTEERQFVAKVQPYTHGTPELTVRPADFGHENARIMDAYRRAVGVTESGQVVNLASGNRSGKRTAKVRTEDCLRASCQRSKSKCRRQVMQLRPTHLYTFTTRATYALDVMWRIWARFVRLMDAADASFRYVVVPQEHPNGKLGHWHFHAPCVTVLNHKAVRRLWHIAVAAESGVRITRTLSGPDAPGNVDDGRRRTKDGRIVSWGGEPSKRAKRMAGYVGRYIVAQFESVEFNRKRYAVSRGLGLPPQVSFYLDALTFEDAVREACRLLRATLPDGSPMLEEPCKPPSVDVVWALLPSHAPPVPVRC